jgi:hypothetical protein
MAAGRVRAATRCRLKTGSRGGTGFVYGIFSFAIEIPRTVMPRIVPTLPAAEVAAAFGRPDSSFVKIVSVIAFIVPRDIDLFF